MGTRECETQLGLKLHPGGELSLACRATTTDPAAPNCNLGTLLLFSCNLSALAGTARPKLEPVPRIPGQEAMVSG